MVGAFSKWENSVGKQDKELQRGKSWKKPGLRDLRIPGSRGTAVCRTSLTPRPVQRELNG